MTAKKSAYSTKQTVTAPLKLVICYLAEAFIQSDLQIKYKASNKYDLKISSSSWSN